MNSANKNIVPTDLIARVLSEEADPEEVKQLETWKHKSDSNQKLFNQYMKLWERSGDVAISTPPDINLEWEKFRNRAGLQSFSKGGTRRLRVTRILAAAVMTGIILGSTAFFSFRYLSFKTVNSKNNIATIELPDNSIVTLNRGSRLKYPRHFKSTARKVSLTGEAFFNVKRNTAAPFSVKSKDVFVEVLGTAFNVNALKKSPTIQVTVEEGKVAVYQEALRENAAILLAGEKAVYDNTIGSIVKTSNSDINYNAWKTGILVFDDTSLSEVTKTLSNVYGTKIGVASSVAGERITVRFDNEDLTYILKTIKATLDINVEEINGTFVLSR